MAAAHTTVCLHYSHQDQRTVVCPREFFELSGIEFCQKICQLANENFGEFVTLAGKSLNVEDIVKNLVNSHASILDIYQKSHSLDGGKKKKKKRREWNTPKHVSHVRKTKPMHIPSLFKMEKDGSLSFKGRYCPDCSKPVCMAVHYNRYYCGLCKRTDFKQTSEAKA
ncbi:MAG: ubiquitin-40S ribosomal protein S27a [Paramarteilia canceri]